jgi:hypothetical protein
MIARRLGLNRSKDSYRKLIDSKLIQIKNLMNLIKAVLKNSPLRMVWERLTVNQDDLPRSVFVLK